MLLLADEALGTTLALLVTFLGVGVVVNVLVVYILAQVMAERRENRELREFREGG
jgi:Na+-transporting methylmalonyl-CoA/oxaloacetate decarboxylase gamma subunit